LVKAILSIRATDRLNFGNHTTLISLVSAEIHVSLEITHTFVLIRVLFAGEVVTGTGLGDGENLISLGDISKHISIGLMLNSLVGGADIRVILLREASVLFLNLLGSSRQRDVKDAIVVLFQHSHRGICCESHSSYLGVRATISYLEQTERPELSI
jgi:hypothetical protein